MFAIKCGYDCMRSRHFFASTSVPMRCVMIHVSDGCVKMNEKLAPHAKSNGSSLEAKQRSTKHPSIIKYDFSYAHTQTQVQYELSPHFCNKNYRLSQK